MSDVLPDEVVLSKGPMFVWGGGKKAKPVMIARSLRALAMILRVGGSEAGALEVVGQEFKKFDVGHAYQNAAKAMRVDGASFRQAMLAQDVFPRTVRELISSTAKASMMHKSLIQASQLVAQAQNMKKKLLTAMIQPGFMLAMCIAFMYAASAFIIPGLIGAFKTLKATTPPAATIVLTAANVTSWVLGALIIVIALSAFFWVAFGRKSDAVRALADTAVNKVPVVGSIVRLAAMSRLFHILSANLAAGRSEPASLLSASAGCGSEALHRHCIRYADAMIQSGARLRDFAKTPLAPLNAQYMLAAAPSIRQEIDIMAELAPEYRKEADQQLDAFSKTIEPIMTYIVYAVAGLLIIAVIVPMYAMFPAIMAIGTN